MRDEALVPTEGIGPVLQSQVTHMIDSRLCTARGSALSCQITSSESCRTHLQLAAGWASSQVWTPLLKAASLRLGAPAAPHTWMSDNVTQPSVSMDSNDYFQVVWQAEDELTDVHLVSVRGGSPGFVKTCVRTKQSWRRLIIYWNRLLCNICWSSNEEEPGCICHDVFSQWFSVRSLWRWAEWRGNRWTLLIPNWQTMLLQRRQ